MQLVLLVFKVMSESLVHKVLMVLKVNRDSKVMWVRLVHRER